MKHLFWSGPRESDIFFTSNFFEGSATFYGTNMNSNKAFCRSNSVRINHNIENDQASDFILNWQLDMIAQYPDCRFMAYNPNCVYGAPEEIVSRTLCLNDETLMKKLNNKFEFRRIAEPVVPVLPMMTLKGEECTWDHLTSVDLFNKFQAFIIQEGVASGGHGTFLLSQKNEHEITALLDKEEEYIVTGYIENNIPVNIHAVIYDNEILLLHPSVQIIHPGNNRLLYRGADFSTYHEIDKTIREQIFSLSYKLCKKLKEMGYRGVAGLDLLLSGDSIYFMEVNNRFQGSSIIINKALQEAGLPSLQQLNFAAFSHSTPERKLIDDVSKLHISNSLFTFVNEFNGIHSHYIYHAASRERLVEKIIQEGYQEDQPAEPYASHFALIFKENITSLCDHNTSVRIHPNIAVPSTEWHEKLLNGDLTAIKTSLINRGAVLTQTAKEYIEKHGKMRIGTYYSLDLFTQGIYINCPLCVKFTALSPFEIDYNPETESLCLKYYGERLMDVDYDVKQTFSQEILNGDTPIEQICFLATDRLRIQNSSFCTFEKHHVTCRFCEAIGIHNQFGEKEILEAIDSIFSAEKLPFRHVLIGGLSNDFGKERSTILHMCETIRKYTDMPIYLMCLPPSDDEIREYFEAGVTEFGFNIEIFDRELAKKYMPGKGRISVSRYLHALETAVTYAGNTGNVRCAFIAGLEPLESVLEGIESVCKIGAAPILSVFRPIPDTEMQNVIPPSDEWLYELLCRGEAICNKYNLTMGPTCPACRNNTLTFVYQGEVEQIYSPLWKRE